jgi:hypothetical protein
MQNLRNLLMMLSSKIILAAGFRPSGAIPYGEYCYEPDHDKNLYREDCSVLWIKPCPHYTVLPFGYRGCRHLGIVTDCSVFADQVKMCSENKSYHYSEN